MNKTNIEYLDYTWNPIAMRCTPISEGCEHCWHIARAMMLAKNPKIPEDIQKIYAGAEPPRLIESRLFGSLKVKKPSMIGVQFMGDLFHNDVQDDQINSVFIRMVNTDWHNYILLTKRPKQMKDFVSIGTGWRQSMPHVWLGVTAENQQTADERILVLLQIPAAVRFVSVEPMLSAVDLKINNWIHHPGEPSINYFPEHNGLDWIIAGPETGPGARECKPEWIADLYEQCKAAGVPFFDKRKNYLAREFPKGA